LPGSLRIAQPALQNRHRLAKKVELESGAEDGLLLERVFVAPDCDEW
jgi:hypothetical protein